MSEENRKHLTTLIEILGDDLAEWDVTDYVGQSLFWDHFFTLGTLIKRIDAELPEFDAVYEAITP